jgi:hypothetical protein
MHALLLLAVWDLKSKHYGVCQGYLYSRWTKTNHWGTELPCVLQGPVFTSIFPLFSWVANHRSSTTLQVWSCQLPPRVRAGCHGSHNWRSTVDWQKKKRVNNCPVAEREREPSSSLSAPWSLSLVVWGAPCCLIISIYCSQIDLEMWRRKNNILQTFSSLLLQTSHNKCNSCNLCTKAASSGNRHQRHLKCWWEGSVNWRNFAVLSLKTSGASSKWTS